VTVLPAFEELLQSNRAIRAAEEAAGRRTVSVGSVSSEEPLAECPASGEGSGEEGLPQLEDLADFPVPAPAVAVQRAAVVTELDGLD
jgi:hypothetical protein